jgi:hypothetical protein
MAFGTSLSVSVILVSDCKDVEPVKILVAEVKIPIIKVGKTDFRIGGDLPETKSCEQRLDAVVFTRDHRNSRRGVIQRREISSPLGLHRYLTSCLTKRL